ncbi:hypothetical protein predicted by Glimmer/Critica [Acetobacter senegalensis]|uniref:Uncharacterized protein n=1 Tax=Acetobacter senegalensis TaxID=446692 RepID=A0A0U5ERJ7_9PROT|nr:hypothetical protein predicted by Glimmer/Critica [Acetobacter senegalensis]
MAAFFQVNIYLISGDVARVTGTGRGAGSRQCSGG